jgi:uncharacterized protein (DUF488 family)
MQTDEFHLQLQELITIASKMRIAIMCAEAVPWRCHRSLFADALLVRRIQAQEIASLTATKASLCTLGLKSRVLI